MAELAARQHGVVARPQLLALGLDTGAITYRLKVGRLHPLHRGFHATPRALEQDRDADLLDARFSTLRITDHRLKKHEAHEAGRLRSILRSRTTYSER